jgi:micrococcal nuclease
MGSARCFTGKVTRIVDGDTIDVNDIRIRLTLVNTPEIGQPLYREARQFTASLCPVGSAVLVDQDDGQLEGSFDRMIGKVFCGDKVLNSELLDAGLAEILQRYCNESEFSDEDWAQQYSC